jgi:hypothetical protein
MTEVKIETLENGFKWKKRLVYALFNACLRRRYGLGWGLI